MEQRSFDKSLPNLKKPLRALPNNNLLKSIDFASPIPSSNLPQLKEKALSSLHGNNTSLLTEVEKDINNADTNARMRDLENKFLDFKTNFEKRVLIMLEENPQKYLRHLKVMEDKDATLWKDSYQKQAKMEEELRAMRDQYQKQNESFFSKILELEAQVQDCRFKIRSNPPNDLNASGILALDSKEYNGSLALYDKRTASANLENMSNSNPLETEVKLLREGLFQEQGRRDILYKDVMNLYKELNTMVHKHENEIIQRFRQQKEELSLETNASKDQLKKIEQFKSESFNNETSLIKNLINSLEKRIKEETDRRMVLEYEIKRLVDDKMSGFKDENVRNEKTFLENEQKYMKKIQESFSSLSQIMKSNKDQLEADIATSQTMTNENFKTLSKTVDFIRESLSGKIIVLENAQKEQSMTLNGVVSDNNRKIEEFHKGISRELERNEKIVGVFEQELNRIVKETESKLEGNVRNLDEWKKKFEGKTQGILKEMSGMLKGLKEEISIDKFEKSEKIKQLMKEHEAISKMHMDLMDNMKTKLLNLNEAFEYKIKELSINWQAESVKNEQKLKEALEDVRRTCRESAEKSIVENIYNLNQKLTLEFKKEMQNHQEINKAIIEETRNRILTDLAYNDQKAVSMINKLKEEFSHRNNTNIKQIQEISEEMRSHKEENKEKLRKLKLDLKTDQEKLGNTLENRIEAASNDLKQEFSLAIGEHRRDFQANLAKNSQESAFQVKSLEEKMQKELEKSGSSMQHVFKEEMLQEAKRVDERFKSMEETMDLNKKMLLEAVSQNAESTKALCRALIIEESARREKAIDDLLKLMNKALDTLEMLLNNKMDKLSEELHATLKQKAEEIEKNMMEMQKKLNENLKEIREQIEKWVNEICVELYLEKSLRKQRDFEFDESLKNAEIRFVNLEDSLSRFKAKTEENQGLLLNQIEGNRAILMENHQLLMDYEKVLNDHEEGLGMVEDKLKAMDDNQRDFDDKMAKVEHELKNHNGRLDILKEDMLENRGMINTVKEELKTDVERLEKNDKATDEKLKEFENQTVEKFEALEKKTEDKFHEIEAKTEENFHKIEERFQELEKKIEDKFEETDKKTEEKFQKSDEKITQIMEIIHKEEKELKDLNDEVKKMDDEINGNNANMYEMEDKFSRYIDKVYIDMESRNYLTDLYTQLQNESESNSENYLKAKINKTSYQVTKIMEKIEEADKIFDQFEVKTDNNFQIAEKAIKAHTRFLNELDARLTIEELFNKVCHRAGEESLKKSVTVINQQIEAINNQQLESNQGSLKGQLEALKELRELEEKTKENEEKIKENEEKILENKESIHLIKGENQNLLEAVKNHANFLNGLDARMTVESLLTQTGQNAIEQKLQKEIDEINDDIKALAEQNLGNLEDKMADFQKKIEQDTIPHTILQMDETMKKINEKTLALNQELAKRTKVLEEKVESQTKTTDNLFNNQKDLETTMLLNATIQRASEKNLMDYCREGFEKTKKVLHELENVTLDQKVDDDNIEALQEDIQLMLGKINELQTEINRMRETMDTFDKKSLAGQMGDLEKKIDKKVAENKATMQEGSKKVVELLEKLQEEIEKLKSKIYVNRE